jgi:hypothetical protein
MFILAISASACTLPPNMPITQKISPWHAQAVPDGSLRVAEVMHVASREELLKSGWHREVLNKAGIGDEQLQDGSAIWGRVQCCGGSNEQGTAIYAFVPSGITVREGDIVEVWSGQMLTEDDPLGPMPNTVTRVVGQGTNGPCRWNPDNPNLWGRVLYCDWMSSEGWSQQKGIADYWIKATGSSATPPKL